MRMLSLTKYFLQNVPFRQWSLQQTPRLDCNLDEHGEMHFRKRDLVQQRWKLELQSMGGRLSMFALFMNGKMQN